MFDLSSSKLLIIGIVALIVVGPKDLPILLRTIGKYVGMIRRQAAEFRSQFDEAMRESELDTVKKDLETMGQDMEKTMREAEMSVDKEVAQANAELDASMNKPSEPVLQVDHPGGLDHTPAPAPVVVPTPEPAKAGT
jgi:sec-independent protein translocase protein TatB